MRLFSEKPQKSKEKFSHMWRLAQTALSTNFVGEIKDYKELIQHLNDQKTQKDISEFCTFNNIAVLFSLS